jgi:hypothetical protein
MVVSGSSLSMSSSLSQSLSSSFSSNLSVWQDNSAASSKPATKDTDKLMMSDHAKAHHARSERTKGEHGKDDSPSMGIIKNILQDSLGVKIGAVNLSELEYSSAYTHTDTQTGQLQISSATATDASTQTQAQTLSGAYDYSSTHYESQKISLSLEGSIRTKDGQELAFTLDLSLSREFASQTELSVRASEGSLSSPITVDYNGLASDLGNQLFAFSLNNPVTQDSPTAGPTVPTNSPTSDSTSTPEVSEEAATTAAPSPVPTPPIEEDKMPDLNSLHKYFQYKGNIDKLCGVSDNPEHNKAKNTLDVAA